MRKKSNKWRAFISCYWMASPTPWMWVWVNSGSWWWTGRPGVLRFMGSQRVGHDWATELNWMSTLESDFNFQNIPPGYPFIVISTVDILAEDTDVPPLDYCCVFWVCRESAKLLPATVPFSLADLLSGMLFLCSLSLYSGFSLKVTSSGNETWCNHYGEQDGDAFKN